MKEKQRFCCFRSVFFSCNDLLFCCSCCFLVCLLHFVSDVEKYNRDKRGNLGGPWSKHNWGTWCETPNGLIKKKESSMSNLSTINRPVLSNPSRPLHQLLPLASCSTYAPTLPAFSRWIVTEIWNCDWNKPFPSPNSIIMYIYGGWLHKVFNIPITYFL